MSDAVQPAEPAPKPYVSPYEERTRARDAAPLIDTVRDLRRLRAAAEEAQWEFAEKRRLFREAAKYVRDRQTRGLAPYRGRRAPIKANHLGATLWPQEAPRFVSEHVQVLGMRAPSILDFTMRPDVEPAKPTSIASRWRALWNPRIDSAEFQAVSIRLTRLYRLKEIFGRTTTAEKRLALANRLSTASLRKNP